MPEKFLFLDMKNKKTVFLRSQTLINKRDTRLYVNTHYLHRYNIPNKKDRFKKRIIMLHNALTGKSSNQDVLHGCTFVVTLEPEILLKAQELVKKLTGNYVGMNDLTNLLFSWFGIEFARDPRRKPSKMPFYRPEEKLGKRLENRKLFEKYFKQYYGNIMGKWEDD